MQPCYSRIRFNVAARTRDKLDKQVLGHARLQGPNGGGEVSMAISIRICAPIQQQVGR